MKASWRLWQDKAKFEWRKQGAGKPKSCTCWLDRNSICKADQVAWERAWRKRGIIDEWNQRVVDKEWRGFGIFEEFLRIRERLTWVEIERW